LIPWKKDPPTPSKLVEGPLTCRICEHHTLDPRPEDLGQVRGNTARFKNRFFTLWRCPECRSIANIEPVDYKDIYRDYPMLKQRLDFFARATFKNLLRRLTQAGLKPGQSVLDIGCGVGVFVEWLKTQGFNDVTGFDPLVPRFASDPVGQQFDCVVANDVLEHVENPRAFLKDAAARVKPGGLLYIGTADAGGVRDMSDLTHHAVRLHQPFHRIIVTAETLDLLTGELGFIPTGQYRRSYLDTRRPFCNYRALDELSRALGYDMDRCFDPAQASQAFANPRVLFFGLFGYYFPSADEPAVILRKPDRTGRGSNGT
jgi:SAM-dependent methyltransferase